MTSLFNVSFSSKKDKVIIAINCGGDTYEDADGVVYEKDNYFDTGNASDYGLQYDISGTDDAEIYQTERWAASDLTYLIPFKPTAGKFVLVLKFSEVYFQMSNEKVFNVGIGDKVVIRDLDIFDRVGKAAAFDEFVEFEMKENKIYVNVII